MKNNPFSERPLSGSSPESERLTGQKERVATGVEEDDGGRSANERLIAESIAATKQNQIDGGALNVRQKHPPAGINL